MLTVELDGEQFSGPYGFVPLGEEEKYTTSLDDSVLEVIDSIHDGVAKRISIKGRPFVLTAEEHKFFSVRSLGTLRDLGRTGLVQHDEWACIIFVRDGTVLGETHRNESRLLELSHRTRTDSVSPLNELHMYLFGELALGTLANL